jgi:hypothetical protein
VEPRDGLDDAERQRLARLVLADWSEAAGARVDSVIVSGRRAAVNVLVNGDYEYSVIFEQNEHGQWYEAGSSSSHSERLMLESLDEEP